MARIFFVLFVGVKLLVGDAYLPPGHALIVAYEANGTCFFWAARTWEQGTEGGQIYNVARTEKNKATSLGGTRGPELLGTPKNGEEYWLGRYESY